MQSSLRRLRNFAVLWRRRRKPGGDQQMLKVLVAFAIIVAAFVFVERTFSPSFQQCIASQENKDASGASENHPSIFGITIDLYVRCTGEFIKESGEAITALATIVIAAFTATLWDATSKQGRLTREALIAERRAFVFAINFTQFWERDPTSGYYNWRFRPIWRNTGDTPTRRMKMHTACELRNTPLPPDFDFDYATTNVGTGLLGPKYENQGGVAPLPPASAITAQDIVDVQKGRKFLYLIGWTRYFDVFPGTPEHITRFCWIILPEGDPPWISLPARLPERPIAFLLTMFTSVEVIAPTRNARNSGA
jgi:hypothetical protein